MSFTVQDLLSDVRSARRYLLKHLRNVRDDQVDWKPYTECKSIREIVEHLIVGERSAVQSMQTGKYPDYETIQAEVTKQMKGKSLSQLLDVLSDDESTTHAMMQKLYGNTSLDEDVTLWGRKSKLGSSIAHLTSEDYYHSGQIAFIRLATDSDWDYYQSIYFND